MPLERASNPKQDDLEPGHTEDEVEMVTYGRSKPPTRRSTSGVPAPMPGLAERTALFEPAGYRVLVTDDNPAIHEDFRKILDRRPNSTKLELERLESCLLGTEAPREAKEERLELSFASQGQEAIEKVRRAREQERPFAVVFMDVRMPPGPDGVTCTAEILKIDPEIHVVICTAHADHGYDTIRELVGDSERLLILKKPFDPIEVRQLVHALTRKWSLARLAGARLEDLEEMVERRTRELLEANRQLREEMEERERAETQLRQAQRLEALGRLAGGVAHDFNNLLTLIQSHGELLIEAHGKLPELLAICDATERAAALTRQLLAFGRRSQLSPVPLDLHEQVVQILRLLRRTIGEDVELSLECAPNTPPVIADPAYLQQAVMNLVLNARDALPKEGGDICIRIGSLGIPNRDAEQARVKPPPAPTPRSEVLVDAAPPGEWVWLEVRDTGAGMDEETAARAFDPYFTTKAMGRGTGLGLPTVLGVVEQTGGHVQLRSRPDAGTSVTIYLPPSSEPIRAKNGERARTGEGGRETILLVEDERPVLDVMSLVLRRSGYRVLTAATPTEALAAWSAHAREIQLLVSDCIMPEMSGPCLAEQLKYDRPELPVLFVSGYARERLGELPSSRFLQKPFPPRTLLQEVRTTLTQSRQHKPLAS